MRRIGFTRLLPWCVLLLAHQDRLAAQLPKPRSLDYLSAAGVDDARASWLNPAGLGRVLEASVMAELVVDRPPAGNARLAQYTLGMNSRGISFAFARDRGSDTLGVSIFRFGLGIPLGRSASVGWAVSLYRGGARDEGVDLGLRYGLGRAIELGAVVRNLSEPAVRDTLLPLTGVGAVAWSPLWQRVELWGEAHAVRLGEEGGYEARYRSGLRVATGGRTPVRLVVSVDFDSSLEPRRWTAGLVVGALDRIGLLGSASPQAGELGRLDRLSAFGLASRRAPGALR
ncbi:MAG: hypothetical protein KatS3mg081_2302 [Gemmatimonadales bacterium]|nr:MAG: hypothetical protein KatS3mg081_2302 [Gemmatimonadales bacterium]